MTKTKVTKKLERKVKAIHKLWIKYLDSLPSEGNREGKEKGYLSVSIWRDSYDVSSTMDDNKLKEENQVNFFKVGIK